MGMMADRGLIDWEAPVTKYWPEFGNRDKGHLKVVEIMRHEGGFPNFSKLMDFESATTEMIKRNEVGRIIENDTFFWFTQEKNNNPAGTEPERAYHALSRGLLMNEVFRRVEPYGRTMGEFLKEEFPEVDVFSGVEDKNLYNRIEDLRDGAHSSMNRFMKRYLGFEIPVPDPAA